jgi:hypothetical protein
MRMTDQAVPNITAPVSPKPHAWGDKDPDVAALLNLSHELRTPAHAILGHIELLLSGAAGPMSCEMRSSLGDVQRAALNLSSRLGEIVTLAEKLPASESHRE